MKVYLAPMIDYTTPNFRRFIRFYNNEVVLFTEMLVCDFIINNDNFMARIGDYDSNTIIQLGGSEPKQFIGAINRIVKASNFRRFNINCGCPSSRVQCGSFGAILMKYPEKVIAIINAVYKDHNIIVDVKCRLGVDEYDSFDFFKNFITQIMQKTPCKTFYIHARKCLLKGLSPAQNRVIPPIKHEFAYEIKQEFPELEIILNGQVFCLKHLKNLDGVMIGRGAKNDIFIFHQISIIKDVLKELRENRVTEKCRQIIDYNYTEYTQHSEYEEYTRHDRNQTPVRYEKNKENEKGGDFENKLNYFLSLNFADLKIPKEMGFRMKFVLKYLESFSTDDLFTHRICLPLFSALKGMKFNKVFKQFLQEILLKKCIILECLKEIKLLFKQFMH